MSELEELKKRYDKETEMKREMCLILPNGDVGREYACRILDSALFSAKSTLSKGSPRRVFIQDLGAALDRRGLLPKEKHGKFVDAGYEYMEA